MFRSHQGGAIGRGLVVQINISTKRSCLPLIKGIISAMSDWFRTCLGSAKTLSKQHLYEKAQTHVFR